MTKASLVRQRIWARLREVALPDSRFHYDFAEFIPDFQGSDEAVDRVLAAPAVAGGDFLFVTPDNGLTALRASLLERGKTLVISTYGIYRGFYLLEPDALPAGIARYAAWLDGLEHFGRPITLAEIAERGPFDAMITGASAVSLNGVRFGKGHGFFDLEWGMFTDIGAASESTPVVAVVHDVQVVEEDLAPGVTDIIVDAIATPGRWLPVARRHPRPHGVHWHLLTAEAIAATPPLMELRERQGLAPL